jgi:hypothetical protein
MALRRPQPADVLQRDTPADYTGIDAPERVLIINLFIALWHKRQISGRGHISGLSFAIVACGRRRAGNDLWRDAVGRSRFWMVRERVFDRRGCRNRARNFAARSVVIGPICARIPEFHRLWFDDRNFPSERAIRVNLLQANSLRDGTGN